MSQLNYYWKQLNVIFHELSFLVNLISSEFFIYPPSLSKARLVAGLAHGIVDTFPKHLVQLRIPVLLVIPLEEHQTISVEMAWNSSVLGED